MLLDDKYFMRQALIEARKAFDENEVPIGAVIVNKQRIVARAHNLTQTLNDVTAHAEMQAITIAENALGAKYLIDCTLYVTVEPCGMCAGALGWAQLSRIVFGTNDVKRGYSTFTSTLLHPKTIVTSGILAEECALLLRNFFVEKR